MTSVSVNQDLDSSFVKGLRLLHSSEPDAEEQLQQLWKQAVLEKYGDRVPTSVLHKVVLPTGLKRECSEIIDAGTPEVKRSKLETSSTLFQKTAPLSSTSSISYSSDIVDIDDSNSDDDSDNDAPMQILTNDGICMKCKSSTSNPNNKLVECDDCHKHYHQQCHFPPITDMDLSDPRFVWYCSSCEENISTSTNDKSKNSGNTNAAKSTATAKGISSAKSTRTYGSSKTASSSSTIKISNDSPTKESASSSSVPERKGHAMKKRSMKKHDKKKGNK